MIHNGAYGVFPYAPFVVGRPFHPSSRYQGSVLTHGNT